MDRLGSLSYQHSLWLLLALCIVLLYSLEVRALLLSLPLSPRHHTPNLLLTHPALHGLSILFHHSPALCTGQRAPPSQAWELTSPREGVTVTPVALFL